MSLINGINVVLQFFPERWPIPLPASAVVVVALTLAINNWVAFDKKKDFFADNQYLRVGSVCSASKFDYIVVGAGTSGMVVATRLANATDGTVLLLEAGGTPSLLNDIPSMDYFLENQPANCFVYNTTPQQNACGQCIDKKGLNTRGKMLGGTSSINFMMYVRGHREDYNRWQVEDAGGDPQWNYPSLLKYFKKSEDYNGYWANDSEADSYHGKGGLLNVATYDFQPGTQQFIDAMVEYGYKAGDYNGARQQRFSFVDITTQNGYRESTYRAFYRDTGKPKNLCIKKYAQVTKIIFGNLRNARPRADGVVYYKQRKYYTVEAKKEVILSAGVFESPKLLMLSGVGPRAHLEEMNIPVVKDLPVGRNLMDHPTAIIGPFLKSPALNPNRDVTVQAAYKYLVNGSGALAAPAGLAGVGFWQSPYAQPSYPDIQLVQFSSALYPELPREFRNYFGISEEIFAEWWDPYHKMNIDSRFIILWLGRPRSVGYVKLASTDPFENPIINPNYLDHPTDLKALLWGFKKAVDIFENSQALNTPLFPKPAPGCENHEFKSDAYYVCVIRQFTGSVLHHVGTCSLGKVVNNQLRVKGIEGLRVVDASIAPRTPNANTQAVAIMIGEKGADLISESRNFRARG